MPKQPEDPKIRNVVVRFPVALHAEVHAAAQAADLTLSQFIRKAVRDALPHRAQ